MTKKKRRGVAAPPASRKKRGAHRPPPPPPMVPTPSPGAPSRAAAIPSSTPTTPLASRRAAPLPIIDLAQEYTYVRGDLRRIAVVGGGIVMFLVILSLFLR